MKKLTLFLQANWFWFLAVFTVVCRLPLLLTNSIPFTFDHGKDALATMHMVLTLSPKLIGPWTSIPGLYFGPGWYYLMAPWYWLGGFNPVAPVVATLGILVVLIWLANRFFGRIPALVMATAPTWLTISSSAWNPFPMPLVSLSLLIGLWSFRSLKDLPSAQSQAWRQLQRLPGWLRWGGVGFLVSLGFHFSTAYAIFYPVIVVASLCWYRFKLSWRDIGMLVVGLAVPFLPQAAFELKHGFGEVKGVLAYLHQGAIPGAMEATPWQVVQASLGELKLAVLPEIRWSSVAWVGQAQVVWLILAVGAALWQLKQRRRFAYGFEVLVWIVLPIVGYFKLHFNFWYLLGMMPIAALVVSQVWTKAPKWLLTVVILGFFATPLSQIYQFWTQERAHFAEDRQMLPVKLKTIQTIRDIAGDRPFAVYHYVPDIYDFSYNYLYFWQAYHGQRLPTEFSYQPNVTTYIKEKDELLQFFAKQQDHRPPAMIFYVVESPHNPDFVRAWWDQQHHGPITQTIEVSPNITVSVAEPESATQLAK